MASFYALRDCNSLLPTVYTTTSLTPGISGYLNQVVQIAEYPDNCWIVIQETGAVIPEIVTVLAVYPDCTTCQQGGPPTPIIYRLRDCNPDPISYLYTNSILTPGIAGYSGGVVYILEYPETCWSVQSYPSGSPVAFTLITGYEKCDVCIAAIPEQPVNVFILEDCLEIEEPIYSFSNILLPVIDKVINIVGSAVCWEVSSVVFDEQITTEVIIATNDADVPQIFEDCECCLPTPEPVPIKYTRVIPKPDRHFYQITQSQCDIRGNIRFADAYYRLFKNLKYGINSQCDTVNLDRIWIKKQLSDLATINDTTACVITTPPTPVICPEPTGNPFVPPTYSFAVGDRSNFNQGTFGCTTCLDGNIPELGFLCPNFNMILDYNILDGIEPDSVYVFSYNGNCIITQGSFITTELFVGYPTYTMTSSNIVNAGFAPASPCTSCQ